MTRQSLSFLVVLCATALFCLLTALNVVEATPCSKPGDLKPIPINACFTRPNPNTFTKTQCNDLNRRCHCQHNAPMKFVGKTCGSGTGDGGCRCASFCNYKCATKCNSDPRGACQWNGVTKKCTNKLTLDEGMTGVCFTTNGPTTNAPSTSPSKTPSKAPQVPTPMPSRGPGAGPCQPEFGLNKQQCNNKKTICAAEGIQMKFTGPGCVLDGKRKRDGGCQCKGYCGFKCPKACNNDDECWWNNDINKCLIKATNETGKAIKLCLESASG